MEDIKVSVICLTYNHIDYIEDALKGFVMQKTDFPYEVLIHDDASTDGTTEVLLRYQKMYPDKIKLYLEEENQYGKKSHTASLMQAAKGKYAAFCEGDDFWIYDGKLQAQYDFMESHPEVSSCYHNGLGYEEELDKFSLIIKEQPSGYLEDRDVICVTKGWYPTASMFLRRDYWLEQPDFGKGVADEVRRNYMACRGKIYFMNRVWCIYRMFAKGSWNEKRRSDRKLVVDYYVDSMNYMDRFDEFSKGRFSEFIPVRRLDYIKKYLSVVLETSYRVEEFLERLKELKVDSNHVKDEVIDTYIQIYVVRCVNYYEYTINNRKSEFIEGGQLYLYGAGQEAVKAYAALQEAGIDFCGFLVTSKQQGRERFLGHPVISVDEIDLNGKVVWPCLILGREEVLSMLKNTGAKVII